MAAVMRGPASRDLDSADALLTLRRHQAIFAWEESNAGEPIQEITCLKHGSNGSVFRARLTASGKSLIAKTGPEKAIATQGLVMGSIRQRFGIPSPKLIAAVDSHDMGAWIFVEDVGDAAATPSSPDEYETYGRALAAIHLVSPHGTSPTGLPWSEAGWGHREARSHIDRLSRITGETDTEILTRDRLAAALGRVVERWDRIERVLVSQPRTLTHGDLAMKHVRWGIDGAAILIDWADAAWDFPVIDLFGLASLDGRATRAYVEAVSLRHPSIKQEIAALIRIGRILRGIRAIGWALARYETGTRERALARFGFYERELQVAMDRVV